MGLMIDGRIGGRIDGPIELAIDVAVLTSFDVAVGAASGQTLPMRSFALELLLR